MQGASEATAGLLEQAWAALGGESDLLELVKVTDESEGLLPSVHAVLPAMVAAVATSTLAASILDATRAQRAPAPVTIDARHVARAARSERYARSETSKPTDPVAPLSRFWRTADGWLRLHANYPWHRSRALGVLECDEEPDAVASAMLAWRGEELEDTLAAAGAVGYAVRTATEWLAHPQGAAVAALPSIEIVDGGRAGRRIGAGRGAVGYRVLDLTRVIAGPVATRTLAAWGAEVLRLDSPHLPELAAQTLDTLAGKRSALLDFSETSGRARLEELLAQADVLVQGYRPDALARYGLGAEQLAERHPHLTVVSLSAWGATGPWATRRGFDSVVQGPTGIAASEGAGNEPGTLPAAALDHATGYLAAAAVLLALAGLQDGSATKIAQLSLAQTAHWLQRAGSATRRPPAKLPTEGFSVTLSGATSPVQVIAPPGRAGALLPKWTATTEFGADRPCFGETALAG